MHNRSLAADHLQRASVRRRALDLLFDGESWDDVVRESQEIAELTLKGLLRVRGIEPPRHPRRVACTPGGALAPA